MDGEVTGCDPVSSEVTGSGDGSTGAGGGVRVVVAHDVITRVVARTTMLRHTLALGTKRHTCCIKGYPMLWIFLELALGLALFVFLVWWTLPKKDKDDRPDG